jgi:tetratricopeptide (TPR) repeat protein
VVEKKKPGCGGEISAAGCYTGMGDCFRDMGQYDEAEAAYTKSISRAKTQGNDRLAAVGLGQLGTVYMQRREFDAALSAHREVLDMFTRLNEPESVAVHWHLIGRAHREAGHLEKAELAYRESLKIYVQLQDRAGQASTLAQLGLLFDFGWNRPDEAIIFFQQAADIYVAIRDLATEGTIRNNLADTLRREQRWEEARQEILRAIECNSQFGHASQPWNGWEILAYIETAKGGTTLAAEARRKARELYLAYRRDGGENHNGDGRLALKVARMLDAREAAAASTQLAELFDNPDFSRHLPFIRTLQAIVAGSRDRSLADNPELFFTEYAEVVILLDQLASPDHPQPNS